MADFSDGPGLVARKRDQWGLKSFVWVRVLATESIDMFASNCYALNSHQRRHLTPAETAVDYLPFAKVLYEEINAFKRFGVANGGTLLSRN